MNIIKPHRVPDSLLDGRNYFNTPSHFHLKVYLFDSCVAPPGLLLLLYQTPNVIVINPGDKVND